MDTHLTLAILGIPLLATTYADRARAVRSALERAQMRAGLSDKYCAAVTELDQSQWTKQRNLGGIVGRLVALPTEFWAEFLPALAQIVGIGESDDDRLERVVRRAIKAELHPKECDTESVSA